MHPEVEMWPMLRSPVKLRQNRQFYRKCICGGKFHVQSVDWSRSAAPASPYGSVNPVVSQIMCNSSVGRIRSGSCWGMRSWVLKILELPRSFRRHWNLNVRSVVYDSTLLLRQFLVDIRLFDWFCKMLPDGCLNFFFGLKQIVFVVKMLFDLRELRCSEFTQKFSSPANFWQNLTGTICYYFRSKSKHIQVFRWKCTKRN